MKVIITLAGHSDRFKRLGYPDKAFIRLFDKLIIEHVVSMFSIDHRDLILIVRKDDLFANKVLKSLFNKALIVPIDPNVDGPVVSVLSADLDNKIRPSEEVVISYCDFYMRFNLDDMIEYMHSLNADGGIVTHNGFHPHKLYNSSFAHLRQRGLDVLEIREKGCFTGNHINEPASSGIYYFKRYQDMIKFFKICVSGNRVNNEFYVTMPFNDMISHGLRVVAYCVDNYVCLGTPKDLELVKAWRIIIDNMGDLSDYDVATTYRYWKKMV